MGIRETLDAQDAEFVSLGTVLKQIADAENVPLKDAARWLTQQLDIEKNGDAPSACQYDVVRGILGANSADLLKALKYVVLNNQLGGAWEDLSDDIPF